MMKLEQYKTTNQAWFVLEDEKVVGTIHAFQILDFVAEQKAKRIKRIGSN